MHRQSLGSPNTKLHHINSHGALIASNESVDLDDHNRIDLQLTSQPDDQLRKSQKSSPGKLIHIIPMLIAFCFLILYLTSHDPSSHKLPEISSLEINDLEEVSVKSDDVLAIRSLQEEIHNNKKESQNNRKLGNFISF